MVVVVVVVVSGGGDGGGGCRRISPRDLRSTIGWSFHGERPFIDRTE